MLENLNLEHILFLDIETVSQNASYDDLDDTWKELWTIKSRLLRRGDPNEPNPADVYNEAGKFAEFGKIICISVGVFILKNDGPPGFKLKSFAGHDEKKLLTDFAEVLNKMQAKFPLMLCAHNGKEFDFPFIARRMVVHGIHLPAALDNAGKKPWEVKHLDTMELWKFGDYKNYTALKLLAALFGIPSPKDDIDGSMIYPTYWIEKDLERIVVYCQKDVLTIAQLIRRFRGEPLIAEENLVYA